MKARPLVPLERKHVYAGVLASLSVAVALYIGDLVQHGFSIRGLVLLAVVTVVMIGSMIWAEWHADNRLESELRNSRRIDRGTARPKRR
jgi:hypothetical protein